MTNIELVEKYKSIVRDLRAEHMFNHQVYENKLSATWNAFEAECAESGFDENTIRDMWVSVVDPE